MFSINGAWPKGHFPCTLYQQSTKVLGASSLLRCFTGYEAVTPRLPLVVVS
jgi:hypothetical protein